MNVPAAELKDFLEEYSTLAFPGQNVLRADFFCHQDGQQWQPVFVLEQSGQQLLADATGNILRRYDRITPLFIPQEETKLAWSVQDLTEQLSGLRSRVRREDYEKARAALEALYRPTLPLCAAYLAELDGLFGVVDPLGQIIVPTQYARIETFALATPGEAGMFLCHRSGHQLNSMDVYDRRGNCIFRQIGSLRPREETILTPAGSEASVRKVKSLWVIRQSIDHPFPEDPDFQLVRDELRRYTCKELRANGTDGLKLAALEDHSDWQYRSAEETPPQDALMPLAVVIAQKAGCSATDVLGRLSDYRSFRLERMPWELRLQKITGTTPLDKLGLSIRAHHCLVRSGLQNASDLNALSEEALSRLRRATPEILQEITLLKSQLKELS